MSAKCGGSFLIGAGNFLLSTGTLFVGSVVYIMILPFVSLGNVAVNFFLSLSPGLIVYVTGTKSLLFSKGVVLGSVSAWTLIIFYRKSVTAGNIGRSLGLILGSSLTSLSSFYGASPYSGSSVSSGMFFGSSG